MPKTTITMTCEGLTFIAEVTRPHEAREVLLALAERIRVWNDVVCAFVPAMRDSHGAVVGQISRTVVTDHQEVENQ